MLHNCNYSNYLPLMLAYTNKSQNIWQPKVLAIQKAMGLILEVSISAIISDSLLTIWLILDLTQFLSHPEAAGCH